MKHSGCIATSISEIKRAYLPGREVNLDHEADSSRTRLHHCTPMRLNPMITPNVGNSTA